MAKRLDKTRPKRWRGPLEWVCTDDGSKGIGLVQSLAEFTGERLLLSIGIAEGNNWSAVFEKPSGGEYTGEMTYVANEDEMEIDEQTGTLAPTPDGPARVSFRLHEAKGRLTVRGKWINGDSGKTYDWTANLTQLRSRSAT